MSAAISSNLHAQLSHRRMRLERAIARSGEAEDLVFLLQQVDGALDRLEAGTLGECEICHTQVDERDLMANPLMRYCLCDLSPDQQRALENDLELASRIQAGLLPEQDLRHAGWEAHYRYQPAGVVSGDYCDVLRPEGGEALYFALGDVSGKGVAASLLMAQLHASFRILAPAAPSVRQLVERANRLLIESTIPSHFATLICGCALPDGEVELCNAGHLPPLWVRSGSTAPEAIETSGPPVGLFREAAYPSVNLTLASGDLLFLYTDGLSESRDPRGREYGTERVSRVVRERWTGPAGGNVRDLGTACLRDLSEHTGGAPRADDVTLLALGRDGGADAR